MSHQAVLIEQGDALPYDVHRFRPKPDAVIEAVQMLQPFVVMMRDGKGAVKADAGDFLVRGTDGELYPCIREVFLQKYEPLG